MNNLISTLSKHNLSLSVCEVVFETPEVFFYDNYKLLYWVVKLRKMARLRSHNEKGSSYLHAATLTFGEKGEVFVSAVAPVRIVCEN